jgi:tripartite-type tricarboxylate transporter receptor subunit TctC
MVAVAAAGSLAPAFANYPDKAIRLVVTFPAGGSLDRVARITAERLSRELGRQVVVENISGAGGTLGVDQVLAAPRDGYTLLFATTGNLVINPHVYKKLRHDPLKEFRVIGPVQMATNALVVQPSLPATTLAEFIAYARANPGKLSYASSGVGSSSHLAGAMLATAAKIDILHVPYRGSSAASADFLGGRIDFMLDSATQYVGLASEGKVRVLGLTSRRKFENLPPWPALSDQGLPGFDITIWTAVMAPTGTPQGVIDTLRQALGKVTSDSSFRKAIAPEDAFVMPLPEFEEFVQKEHTKWGRLVQESGAAGSQ